MANYLGMEYIAEELSDALNQKVNDQLRDLQNQQYYEVIKELEEELRKAPEGSRTQVELNKRLKYLERDRDRYPSEYLWKRKRKNKLVGLVFKPDDSQSLTIHAVFFDVRFVLGNYVYRNAAFSSLPIDIQGKPFSLPNKVSLPGLNFQFWDSNIEGDEKKIRLAFFGVEELKLILEGSNVIKISGGAVEYGFSTLGDTKDKAYASLKIETGHIKINSDDEVPNIAMGIPCPTLWGNSKFIGYIMEYIKIPKDLSSGITDSNQNSIAESLLPEVESFFNSFE